MKKSYKQIDSLVEQFPLVTYIVNSLYKPHCISCNFTIMCWHIIRFGVIYKEMHLPIEARKMFLRSVHLTPLLWASWFELAKLCESREMVRMESLHQFCIVTLKVHCHTYMELSTTRE